MPVLSYASKHIVSFLRANVHNVSESNNLPLNSRNRSSVIYLICELLQQLMYCQKTPNIKHLKKVLCSWWDIITHYLIDTALTQYSKCVTVVVQMQHTYTMHQSVTHFLIIFYSY